MPGASKPWKEKMNEQTLNWVENESTNFFLIFDLEEGGFWRQNMETFARVADIGNGHFRFVGFARCISAERTEKRKTETSKRNEKLKTYPKCTIRGLASKETARPIFS
jgi:hypothetical protein